MADQMKKPGLEAFSRAVDLANQYEKVEIGQIDESMLREEVKITPEDESWVSVLVDRVNHLAAEKNIPAIELLRSLVASAGGFEQQAAKPPIPSAEDIRLKGLPPTNK